MVFFREQRLYSIYDSLTAKVIKELMYRGHSVQLHIDAGSTKSTSELRKLVIEKAVRFREMYDISTSSFSFHRPYATNQLPGSPETVWIPDMRCTYDGDIFFGSDYYCDSNHKSIDLLKLSDSINGK